MEIRLLHKEYDPGHLENVKREMASIGAPTIKGVWDEEEDCWFALEGCHRIRAAKELGLTPEMIEVEWEDHDKTLEEIGLDRENCGIYADKTLLDIVNEMIRESIAINF